MTDDKRKQLEKELNIRIRYLNELKLKEARLGNSFPIPDKLEMEDYEDKIDELKEQLDILSEQDFSPMPILDFETTILDESNKDLLVKSQLSLQDLIEMFTSQTEKIKNVYVALVEFSRGTDESEFSGEFSAVLRSFIEALNTTSLNLAVHLDLTIILMMKAVKRFSSNGEGLNTSGLKISLQAIKEAYVDLIRMYSGVEKGLADFPPYTTELIVLRYYALEAIKRHNEEVLGRMIETLSVAVSQLDELNLNDS